jgi:predicted nucleotidyltransferase
MYYKVKNMSENLIEYAKKDANIKAVYLFGSFAKGKATYKSDVDFAVICDTPASKATRRNLHGSLENIYDQYLLEYDLVFTTADKLNKNYNASDISDINEIIREEGVLLWQRE